MKKLIVNLVLIISIPFALFTACNEESVKKANDKDKAKEKPMDINSKVAAYAPFELKADISSLSDKQKKMLSILFEVAQIMDDIYWEQTYGNKELLFDSLLNNDAEKEFAAINYGPWERLNGNKSFVKNIGEKPKGAQFYPKDMTNEEFKNFGDVDKESQYTLLRRDENGKLKTVWYHEAYKEKIDKAVKLLKEAAKYAKSKDFKKYLLLRAEALATDDYFKSDMAWMDMKDNDIDFVVGPIENYEDKLFGYKTAHEAFILIKDKEWSKKLQRFASLMPQMQKELPVDAKYKAEKPGANSDLGAYQVVYYAGDCNAGSKTIAINLPNDPRVQLEKGSRRLQLKNAMQAKFDKILIPISNILIDEKQRKHVTFDAFFENTMFHETAHGLGIKETITGKGPVRQSLKEYSSTLEEGKADILGLFFVTKLHEMGEFKDKDLMDNYVTFLAGIFRSVRFGVSSSHGKANMLRFYYFKEAGAFTYDEKTKTYSVNFDKMKEAMTSLTNKILTIQGDGDYEAAKKWVETKGVIDENLKKDLARINEAGIPMDIVFKQGLQKLGL